MKSAQKRRIRKLMANHGLRITQSRIAVLDIFLKKKVAMSHASLEEALSEEDRITLYRTLNTFLENGLLHRVIDDSGILMYALCEEGCTPDRHRDTHVHFKCYECGITQCLTEFEVPEINLPNGFTFEDANMLIQGTCDKCSVL